ncbi:polyketide synthase [Telmatospirillum sp.]|uniref:polyketide synthase n=1 Tax=Telmatospirillum sp. TaxID=2079197 RepID=UPI00283D63AF|nr:polyketide synthase [Telmatospirillum sp.]MDR3436279.1 amino acid adenylation domain-containing protein [Telmatospirillum sp.]
MRRATPDGTASAAAWEDGPILSDGLGDRALVDVFADAAARRPHAVAVIDRGGNRNTDYLTLAGLVSSWSARLIREGVGPGTAVGLCAIAEREVPVGFLAILSAGATVVPLDPSLPPERLLTLAQGTGCHLILASDGARAALPTDLAGLNLSEEIASDGSAIAPPFDPDHVAVIYHTSGSTGRPKPVALTHRTLSSRLLSMMAWFGIADDEVVCGSATLAFDPFLQQLFFPLCGGGTLWLPDRSVLLDPALFWPQVSEHGVTHLNLVPSQVEALLHHPLATPPVALRRLVMGGESLPAGLPARIETALGPVAIYNMYGPTEAAVDACGQRVAPSANDAIVPIGKPLPGCRVRILDKRLRRVPVGTTGELCIGGVGLAIGYPGLPDETARAFVADPFGEAGDRLYRTGDLARWRDDGSLIFLGRHDDQVKIRGHRLELGEIEAAIRAVPGVVMASVSKWDDAACGPALVAHVVGDVDFAALRHELARRLPAAAIPAHILRLDRMPTLPSGKIDRKALPKPTAQPLPLPMTGPLTGQAALEQKIAAVWAGLLGRAIDVTANLFEMGAHSLMVPRALVDIAAATGQPLSAVELFRFPTVATLARHLAVPETPTGETAIQTRASGGRDEIAVVGMAFRFPGAADRDGFWSNLINGTDSLRRHDLATLRRAGAPLALLDHPDFIPVYGAIDGTDCFDAGLFGYSPGEAAEIDPQQRLLLQLSWQALEDAACDAAVDGPVGVFAGVGFNSYLVDNLHHRIGFGGGTERCSMVVNGDKDFAATRIAYKLGLTGPAMTINSACSTALSATAVAVDSLWAGRCRVALVGAASFGMFSPYGHIHAEGGIASRSGTCRPFDATADGIVAGAGMAVLVLKRLEDALADGDTPAATIRGIGIANDGGGKAAFAAPSVDGQVAAITAALADAGVTPGEIGFVEGHGTATALGDPIEVAALNIAYRGAERGSIRLGSVKGNVGHLDAAAGMAGLIKAILTVSRGTVPPTAHFTAANPDIAFADGPFRVNAQPEPWDGPAERRRQAGVSAFGMGGTNIHVVVSQAPAAAMTAAASGPVLLTLSAASQTAEAALVAVLSQHLDHLAADIPLAVAASSLARRRTLRFRRAIVAASATEAAAALCSAGPAETATTGGTPTIAFLFPGQGAQRPGMATDLYRAIPAFRAVIDEADRILADTPIAGLRALLLAAADDSAAMRTLSETEWTQPALFVTEYATAMALHSYGVRPSLLAGHSVGEYVAACLAGVMAFDDALRLVEARGRLVASAARGAMLAVSMTEAELTPLLERTGTDLAAVNGTRQCVASGNEAAITALAEAVDALGRPARRLPVSHGFHSRLMDPIGDAFTAEVARVSLSAPAIPIISTLTGAPLTAAEATDPGYWGRHLRGAVRFADALARLAAEPSALLVEAGPGATLSRLARAAGIAETRAIAVQPADQTDGQVAFLEALGRMWTAGVAIDRLAAAGGAKQRTSLPGYPFEAVRLWIDPPTAGQSVLSEPPEERRAPTANNNFVGAAAVIAQVWQDVLGVPTIGPDSDFLALGGDSLIAVRIAQRLREKLGCDVEAGALFREGTVAGLARLLDARRTTDPELLREEGWL